MPEKGLPLIALRGVCVRRGKREVLLGVDLDLSAGELLIISGPNGSGKSTLLESAAGLISLEKGAVHHREPGSGELMVVRDQAGRWRRIAAFGLTLQADATARDMRVKEHLSFASLAYGVALDDERAMQLLDDWGLRHRAHDPVAWLSHGLRRRLATLVGLLPGLVSEKPCGILLDEPTEGLDEWSVRRTLEALEQLTQRGCGIMVATHDERILQAADRLVEIPEDGVITGDVVEFHPVKSTVGQTGLTLQLLLAWALTLDRRTWSTVTGRGLAGILALLLVLAISPPAADDAFQMVAALVLMPGLIAALMPPVHVNWWSEDRCGDWWRAISAGASTRSGARYSELSMIPLAFVLSMLSPLVFPAAAQAVELPRLQLALLAMVALPFFAGASASIHLAISRLPRARSTTPLLMLVALAYPLLLLVDAGAALIENPAGWSEWGLESPLVLAAISIGLLSILTVTADMLNES